MPLSLQQSSPGNEIQNFQGVQVPEDPTSYGLTRGTYRIRFTVKLDQVPEFALPTSLSKMLLLDTGEELKRVDMVKFDLMTPNEDGEAVAVGVFRIIDNPIWIPALMTAIAATVGGVIAWMTVDDVQGAVDGIGTWGEGLLQAAAIAALVFAIAGFSK